MSLSEIRVNTTKTRTGVGTITYTETGPVITGIATASNFKTGSTNVHSTGVEVANINTGGSTATFGGAISGTTASFSGNVSIGGTLTYEDVTNIDSVGILTARDDVNIIGDNKKLKFGAGNDLNLYSTGTNGWVYTPQSGADLYMGTNAGEIYIQTGSSGNDTAIKVNSGGSVELNHSTNKKLETTSSGATVSGALISSYGGITTRLGFVSGGAEGVIETTSNHSLVLGVNSSEKVRITSDGKFGLNTTAPYAYDTTATTLEVKGSVSSAADTEVVRFRGGSDANGGTAVLRLTNDNDRGLVVKGGRESDAEFAEFGVSAFNGSYTRGIRITSAGDVLMGGLTSKSGASTAILSVEGGNDNIGIINVHAGGGESDGELSGITFSHGGSANTTSRAKAAIALRAIGSYGRGDLCFYVDGTGDNNEVAAADEKLRITSAGLFKVNSTDGGSHHTIRHNTTTNNAIKDVLHVHSSVDSATAAAGYGVRLNFSGEQSNGNEYTYGGIAGLYHDGGANNGQLAFYTNYNGTNTERLRITSGGSVNIGGNYTQTGYMMQIAGDLLLQKSQAAYQHPQLEIYNSNNSAHGGAVKFTGYHSGSGGKYQQAVIKAFGGTGLNTGSLVFVTGNNDDKMRMHSDGSIEFKNQTEANIRVDDGNTVNGSALKITIDGTEEFRFDPGSLEFKNNTNLSRGTLLGGINYYSNTNAYVDLTQWRLSDNWNILEVFGYVNPNSSGSGQYTDPLHMYIYRGVGYNSGIKNYIYSVHVAPPARQAFPGGSGMSGNSGVSAVWCNSGSVVGNESATGSHYVRLVIPNANASNNFQKTFRILRRF